MVPLSEDGQLFDAHVRPAPPPPLSAGRRAIFTTLDVLLPFVCLAGVELTLRVLWRGGALPLFVPTVAAGGHAREAVNPLVGRRWFTGPAALAPPSANYRPFFVRKPTHTLRIFAMGESTTAGFPYPPNGTFTRLVEEALQDVLPADSVQVINIGIPATDSYALVDEADEVIAQHPDAVMIYAGHNEFYGALGVGATGPILSGHPQLVRAYVRLQHLRTVLAVRAGMLWLRGRLHHGTRLETGLDETLVAQQEVPLAGAMYRRGERQFASNLALLLDRFRAAHVPVFIGSQSSNVRDRHPFVVEANGTIDGADTSYTRAESSWTRGDSVAAHRLFIRARDLDVVRFRASSDFNAIIRDAARSHGAVYVPVAEEMSNAALGRSPGNDLFLEHVHPNLRGITVIARAFFGAIATDNYLGRPAQPLRLRSWDTYARGLDLTAFDRRVASLAARAVESRWPFVPANRQTDLGRDYQPTSLIDSLALDVALGAPWRSAKFFLAQTYERRGFADSAADELRGAVIDSPIPEPWEMLARAYARAGQPDSAYVAYQNAIAIHPSSASAQAAAEIALDRRDYAEAIPLLRLSLSLDPADPETLYRLVVAYARSGNLEAAQHFASRLVQTEPADLAWADSLRAIGMLR